MVPPTWGCAGAFAWRDHCTAAVGNVGRDARPRLASLRVLRSLRHLRRGVAVDPGPDPGTVCLLACKAQLVRSAAADCACGLLLLIDLDRNAGFLGAFLISSAVI